MPSPWDYNSGWLLLNWPSRGPVYYIGAMCHETGDRFLLAVKKGTRRGAFEPISEHQVRFRASNFYSYDSAAYALKVVGLGKLKELPNSRYTLGIINARTGVPMATLPITVNNGVNDVQSKHKQGDGCDQRDYPVQ